MEPMGSDWTYEQAAAAGPRQLRWNHNDPSAHHDAYLWAQRGVGGKEMSMAVQCKNGQAKTEEELDRQVKRNRGGKKPLGLPLLVCYAGREEVSEMLVGSVVAVGDSGGKRLAVAADAWVAQ